MDEKKMKYVLKGYQQCYSKLYSRTNDYINSLLEFNIMDLMILLKYLVAINNYFKCLYKYFKENNFDKITETNEAIMVNYNLIKQSYNTTLNISQLHLNNINKFNINDQFIFHITEKILYSINNNLYEIYTNILNIHEFFRYKFNIEFIDIFTPLNLTNFVIQNNDDRLNGTFTKMSDDKLYFFDESSEEIFVDLSNEILVNIFYGNDFDKSNFESLKLFMIFYNQFYYALVNDVIKCINSFKEFNIMDFMIIKSYLQEINNNFTYIYNYNNEDINRIIIIDNNRIKKAIDIIIKNYILILTYPKLSKNITHMKISNRNKFNKDKYICELTKKLIYDINYKLSQIHNIIYNIFIIYRYQYDFLFSNIFDKLHLNDIIISSYKNISLEEAKFTFFGKS